MFGAWQKLDQFQGTDDEEQARTMFRAWLGRLVSRLNLNAQPTVGERRSPPGKLLPLQQNGSSALPCDPSAAEPTPSANAQATEQARLVHEALERLPDGHDREIVRLRFFEGVSLRQIAEHLGCSHETTRQRYHVLMDRLQCELEGLL